MKSASTEVSFLAQIAKEDIRSTTAKNLHFIQQETGLDPLTTNSVKIKEKATKTKVPEGQEWRLSTLEFLLEERKRR